MMRTDPTLTTSEAQRVMCPACGWNTTRARRSEQPFFGTCTCGEPLVVRGRVQADRRAAKAKADLAVWGQA